MPLVRVTGDRTVERLGAIGEAVHAAMVETLGVPADDVFRVLQAVSEGGIVADPGYLGIARIDPVFVEITLRAGRTDERKRAFYARAVALIAERTSTRAEDVLIALRENGLADWSFGNGIAQYAPAAE